MSEKEKPISVIGAVHAALDNGKITGGRMVAVRKGSEESFSSLISAFSNYLKSKNWLLPFTIPVDNTVEY